MKAFIRRLVPESIVGGYHLALAVLAAFWYGHPSEKLVVIGVTGTNGKSTTTEFIGRMLEHAGHRVGWTGTASFKVGDREWTNDKKMTMLGRFETQRLLRDMVRAGCTHAIVETSSQGLMQHRHVGINYDVAVFTNLTPEHIEAHGGFENYKRAKGVLFAALGKGQIKRTLPRRQAGKNQKRVEKTIVVNLDDPHAEYFLSFPADKRYGFGIDSTSTAPAVIPVVARNLRLDAGGSTFETEGREFHLKPIGRFNVYNGLAAMATGRALGLSWDVVRDAVGRLESVSGRLEAIVEGQPFAVIVDYAYEPAALGAAYDALELLRGRTTPGPSLERRGRLIHVVGSAGGGRDVARRAELGRMAAEHDDVVIVTNEDPYDEDPMAIVRQVADGARTGKTEGADLFLVLDRGEAIRKAVSLAVAGDLVLITGKGCEPVMAVANGRKVPSDDRVFARSALRDLGYGLPH